ncbi:hypothetical protein [Nocardia sp. 348MFTsu5.1]|uniref:hypothetical protein n=1 Tax=Nocardia sp. 348MFTsu5.1 TaxID=1172185 RepID=UPI0012DFBB58|nr:hypothetical protein [Nocardia sp. 348MFTsu5.1]
MTTQTNQAPSPWPGSEYSAQLDWDLDDVGTLPELAGKLTATGEQLLAAHVAGWTLVAPMSDGRLHARRQSRRMRGRAPVSPVGIPSGDLAPRLRWRLRIVDEPADERSDRLTVEAATATPWLLARGDRLEQLSGPEIDADTLARVQAQFGPGEAGDRRWALVSARIGPSKDLIAEGSRLRLHAVVDGVVLRTVETLGHRHAADRATDLPAAAGAYRRLAAAAMAMHQAGGRLGAIDDGFVVVEYPVR